MNPDPTSLRVAVAQVTSVFLDRDGCVAKAVGLIEEAGRQGVELLVFPEGYLPAHPVWYHFEAATSRRAQALNVALFENSVLIPGPETGVICDAAREAGTAVVMGVCERRPDTSGSLYNSQIFIDRNGDIVGKHQKLTPTVGERLVHTGGYGDTLSAYRLTLATSDPVRVGGLICAENSNGLASAALDAAGTQIYASSWPCHFAREGRRMDDIVLFSSRSLAYRTGAAVLSACGVVSDDLIDRVAVTETDREFLKDRSNGGGSCIVNAFTTVVAGPMPGGEEGLLTATVDLRDSVRAKSILDYSGHYNRPDVFTLEINRTVPNLVRNQAGPEGSRL